MLRSPEGTPEEERAWKLLLLRKRLLFAAPLRLTEPRGRTSNEARLDLGRLVRERAGALLRGDWAELLAETRATAKALAGSRERRGATARDESHLAECGHSVTGS